MSEQDNSQTRIFKIGATRISEDVNMLGLSNEQVREILKRSYPEVAHATIRERQLEDGTTLVEMLPQAGRKG